MNDDEWSDDHLAVLPAEAQRTEAELVHGRMRISIHGTGPGDLARELAPQRGDF
jgi:hypothetical protein